MKRLSRLLIAGIMLSMVYVIAACGGGTKEKAIVTEEPNVLESADPLMTAILTGVDETGTSITVVDLGYNQTTIIEIAGSTQIYKSDKSLTTVNSLEQGMILTVEYDRTTRVAISIEPYEEAWCYDDIVSWSVDPENQIFKIADTKYQYDSNTVIIDGDKTQDIMCLNQVDKLRAYGVGKQIYSIDVEEGHGYIRPSDYIDFVGGVMSIGYTQNQPITEDMLAVARVGTYEVTMRNGNLVGTKTIEVVANEETILDMSEFKQPVVSRGEVEFKVTPIGADLYVNGRLVDSTKPLELNYGEHDIEVELTGYEPYSGVLDVNSPNPTVVINLTEEEAEIEDESSESSSSSNNSSNSSSSTSNSTTSSSSTSSSSSATASTDSSTQSIKYDKDHTITVSTPVGAEIYINGEYKGKAPCSFPKQIGTATLTLSSSGYTTKSYTVVITDDSKDVTWSFPSLVAEGS